MIDELRSAVRRHLDWFVPAARAAGDGVLWPSCLGHDGRRGDGSHGPAGVAKRCYRAIAAPGGSNLSWDLPLVAAADLAGHGDAARAYVTGYLERCTAPDGLPWWGNHAYYHFDHAAPVVFNGEQTPRPVDPAEERFALHELRPLAVDWDLLRRWWPAGTADIVTGLRHHLVAAGGFNRHADGRVGLAFIESGAVLVDAFAWAGARGDATAAQRARDVANWVGAHADAVTGLVPTAPGSARWDGVTATSEVGAWALGALRAAGHLAEPQLAAAPMAALTAWHAAAWDAEAGRFRGRIACVDGAHVSEPLTSPYKPGTWSDPWRPVFPSHDHPWQAALACLVAWRSSGDDRHRRDLDRWRAVIATSLPARGGEGGYAEHYGRGIHLARAAWLLTGDGSWRDLGRRLADEALAVLATGGRLRSHPFEDRCDAVDGLGFLALAAQLDDDAIAADPGAWPW